VSEKSLLVRVKRL